MSEVRSIASMAATILLRNDPNYSMGLQHNFRVFNGAAAILLRNVYVFHECQTWTIHASMGPQHCCGMANTSFRYIRRSFSFTTWFFIFVTFSFTPAYLTYPLTSFLIYLLQIVTWPYLASKPSWVLHYNYWPSIMHQDPNNYYQFMTYSKKPCLSPYSIIWI